jgi:hypothetical protein
MYFPDDSIQPADQASPMIDTTPSGGTWTPEDFTPEQKQFDVTTGGFAGDFEVARY